MWIKIFSTYGSGRGISLTLATINDSSFTMANLTESVFSEFYQMTVSKTLGISASLITIVFVPMMIYCIYWYGKNCSKRERTLINNLAFSSSLCGVAYSVLQSPLELYITCFQPVPPILSAVAIILRNSLTGHFLTLLGVISLVRYVYIFIHKCPAGAHDNFWWLFINAATLQLQLVFNIAHFLLPGRHFILFYVWTNTLPQKNDMHKVHIFLIVCFILSLSICIFVELRVKILRLKDTQTLFLSNRQALEFRVKDVVENSFVGFIYILVGLGSICLALGFPIILELKTQESLNRNYHLAYIQIHWIPLTIITLIFFTNVCTNKRMLKFLSKELRNKIINF